jgi:hypothetical protein
LPKGYYRARSGTIRVSHPGQSEDSSISGDPCLNGIVTPTRKAVHARNAYSAALEARRFDDDFHERRLVPALSAAPISELPVLTLESAGSSALDADRQALFSRYEREKLWRQGLAVRMRIEDEALGDQLPGELDDELLLTHRWAQFPWIAEEQFWTEHANEQL